MKQNNFAKNLTKEVITILTADTVDTNTLTDVITDAICGYAASSKSDITQAAAEAEAAIDSALNTFNAGYKLSSDRRSALDSAILTAKTTLANRKASLLNLAAIRVTYEGSYTVKAKLVYTESNDDLAFATSTPRFLEAKKALEAAGVKIPAAGASRNEWTAARDSAATDELKRALNAVRGAYEDVVAAGRGEKKVHAEIVQILSRKINETEAPVDELILPKKMRSLHFYVPAGNGLDTDVLRGRFLKANLLVEIDAKGRVLLTKPC